MARLRLLVAFYMVSVVVKALTGLLISQPGYMDAYYYFGVAANLASGRGFVEDFLWNYLDNPTSLPHPSNLYWLPLTSIVIAPALALFGESFRAAQAAMVLAASLLPPIAYVTAERFGLSRFQCAAVAALTIFNGGYFSYGAAPDVLAVFAVTGSLALYSAARGMAGSRLWFVAAAAWSGMSQLARPDGVLLLAVTLASVLARWWMERRGRAAGDGKLGAGRLAVGTGAAMAVAFLAVLSPWLFHNIQAVGTPWPAGGEALFQREYNDVFRYGRTLDLSYYLDWGWQEIAKSKLKSAGENLLVFAGAFLFYLVPFGLLGSWRVRRDAGSWPYLLYALALYSAMTLLFTFAGPRGSYLHSMGALLPFYAVVTVKGIEAAVHWAAGRLKHWVEPTAQRNFLGIVVVVAAVMSVVLAVRAASTWDDRFRLYERVAEWYRANAAPGDVVMAVDPPGWYYSAKSPAVNFASEDLATNLAIAHQFRVRYVILEAAHPLSLHKLYLGEETPPELELRVEIQGIRVYEYVPNRNGL